MKKLFCIGHRGARGHAPENTLLSIRRAFELGADGVEIDVHLHEGRLIALHDETVDRTTDGSGPFNGFPLTTLRKLDAGSGEKIPFLEEVLAAAEGRGLLNIELKGHGTALPAARLVARSISAGNWKRENFILSSFHHEELEMIAAEPLNRGLLLGDDLKGWREFHQKIPLHALHPRHDLVTGRFVQEAHEAGLKIFCYTVNHPHDFARMTQLGVDGVFTDYPDRAKSGWPAATTSPAGFEKQRDW